ncbi:serpin family protein [Terricaulis silvestris]|uniref:Serine protease inhibitor-like protein n=1 Tax=Terricaulis silvestris TaxID=2686094 RepID=A0A6I6MM00_9CAUL|nr:serpin family protein [Terricaulis silvestris]QGZ94338.1 serine protease inhibitor-like protein [Terricaulis silvestris]
MHRRSLLLSATALAITACAAPTANEPDAPMEPTAPPAIDPNDAAFDTALYRAVATEPGNQFVSPYSVSSAFALVYPGAGGQTASEIATVFGFDASAETEARETRTLADSLRAQTGGSDFTVANAAWVEQTMQLRPAYARTIRDTIGGTIEPVPFIANQPAALRTINAWAARETRDRIPSILTEENPDRRLVLTNAVYFKGKWSHQFRASSTRDGDFFTSETARVPTRLMRQLTNARYIETPTFQAADFDYDDGAFALAVFLPRQRTGLAAFERELTGARLDGWMNQLSSAERPRLDLTLPKVEMRANYMLNEALQAMGVREAFTYGADLDAMADDPNLMISQVIHKTFLAIDEEGTEAAAVTAIDIVTTAAPSGPPPPPPIEFKADHPFFIVLHHKPTRTRLFLGRIATV